MQTLKVFTECEWDKFRNDMAVAMRKETLGIRMIDLDTRRDMFADGRAEDWWRGVVELATIAALSKQNK